MNADQLRLRSMFGFGLVFGAFGLLALRLAYIQLGAHSAWSDAAHAQHYGEEREIPAARGTIYDRNGVVLARTIDLPSVAIDPGMVKDRATLARLFEQHLRIPRAEVLDLLAKGGRFRWVRRQLKDRDAVEALRRACRSAKIEGLVVRDEPRRDYPQGVLAAHILGFTDRDGNGLEGVESLRNRELAGLPGRATTLRDASGYEIVTAGREHMPPVDGSDVHLTIDLAIQSFAEQAAEDIWTTHNPDGVTCAVMDVTTGEILGVACRPTFDPNDPKTSKPEQRRNRFFTDAYEPGSVFKTIMMAAALDAGVVRLDETFTCNDGGFRVGGRVIHEDKHKHYGTLGLSGIIAHSSNVGMAQIGDRLGIPRARAALATWGFGSRTNIGWPGEQKGDIQAGRNWTRGDHLMSVSFGHAITTTPAQILQSYAVLGADGVRHDMKLFLDQPASENGARVCSPKTARALAPMLEEVLGEDGTANWVYKTKDYRIGGKTGTAQKLQTGGHVASFACIGPLEDPRLAVIVIADEPRKNGYYGSTVGAKRAIPLMRSSLRTLGFPTSPPLRGAAAPESESVGANFDVPQNVPQKERAR